MVRFKYRYPIYKKMHKAGVLVCIMHYRRPWYCPSCVKRFKQKK